MKEIKRFNSFILQRAENAIAHGALTNSKRPQSFIKSVYPTHVKESKGCYTVDIDGNKYIDFIAGLGVNLLGAMPEEIRNACIEALLMGNQHSLSTLLEIETAERLKEFFPFVEKFRFLKTGSEATAAALRIARTFTDKQIVLSEGYHGWHDEFTSLTPPANGCYWKNKTIRELRHLERQLDSESGPIAAVILEPVITDISEERIAFLRRIRELCTIKKALLIFDEVITGFRFPGFSVSQHFGITPDLICLGKALGGGFSLSAVGGKNTVMERDYFVSSTFSGETLALTACRKALDLIDHKFSIPLLWEKGRLFMEKFNALYPEKIWLEGYPTRSIFRGDEVVKALFMQESCLSNILVGPSFFFTFSHLEVMEEVLSSFQDILTRIKHGEVSLKGEMPVSPFSERVRHDGIRKNDS